MISLMRRRDVLRALGGLGWASACKRSERTVIGVAPKGTSSIFWQSVHAGGIAAGEKYDVDGLWNGPPQETEYARQIQIVESMINRRVDGIVLSPSESTALVGVVERAAELGIPVTVFDSGIDTDNYVCFVATDNAGAGRLAAETLNAMLGGKGRLGMVKHVPGSASTGNREIGFHAALEEEYTGLEIVNEQYCMSDRTRALSITEDMLTAHPDLDALFCSSEAATVGASQAVRAREMAGKVKLVGFDASPTLQKNLREGIIDALIVQEPYNMGYRGVETVVQKLRGETPPKRIDSPARVIRAEDLDTPEVRQLLNPDLDRV